MSEENSEEKSPVRRRSGGRSGRMQSIAETKITGLESGSACFEANIPYYEPLKQDQLELIRQHSDWILKEIGIEYHDDPEALEIWKKAGAKIDGRRVRMELSLAEELIRNTAPSSFTQHARNPERNVVIGGNNVVHAPVYGPPFVRDEEQGRRYATIEDFQNFVKMTYMSIGLNHSGGTVCEPVDVPVNKRHLDMLYSHILYSDKPYMGSVTAPERAQDSVDIAKIIFGADFVDQNCTMVSLINVNSPLVFDATMTGALKVYCRNNQACIVSPFMLSGAMGPVTVPAVLAQAYAESSVGCAFTQLLRPGCPVIFGSFIPSVSMQNGAPMFGTPESEYIIGAFAQLARFLGLPSRTGGSLCGSKLPDAQAAYESSKTLKACTISGVNFILHAAGWLEGGLSSSYEKFIMDAEQLVMATRYLKGYAFDENDFAKDAFKEVGPGKHFLGCAHTQANFKSAFYTSPIDDNNSFEQWDIEGKKDLIMRSGEHHKKLLQSYESPEINPDMNKAVCAFIKQKKDAVPDSWI